MEVPDGEHVSFVSGNSGWYIDNLQFMTSSGKRLGQLSNTYQNIHCSFYFTGPNTVVGGDGGDFRNPLSTMDPKYNSFNTYLDGFQVHSFLL